jgi:hypothetical protein
LLGNKLGKVGKTSSISQEDRVAGKDCLLRENEGLQRTTKKELRKKFCPEYWFQLFQRLDPWVP